MPFFSNAQNLVFHGAVFTENTHTPASLSSTHPSPSSPLPGIGILRAASAPDAAHDSEARRYVPSCFPGTRQQHIEDITHWAVPSIATEYPSMYWMAGLAGVGKSAIAQTCAEYLKQSGHLGASFFFSVNQCKDHTRLFTSIAYQLSTQFPDYRDILDRNLASNSALVEGKISSQFTSLIVDPLRQLEQLGRGIGRRAIFIDGLDECQSKQAQCEIIEIIAASVRDRTTPLCWAFFSRPEPHIETTFAKSHISRLCLASILPISRDVDREIELYLRGGFENILRQRNLSTPSTWPPDNDIHKIVAASAGLFVYPATVLRFIDGYPSVASEKLLAEVLNTVAQLDKRPNPHTSEQFTELDAFYALIMQRIPDHTLPSALLLLANMSWESSQPQSAILLGNRLGLSEDEFKALCNQLCAVVHFRARPEPPDFDESVDVNLSFNQTNTAILAQLKKHTMDAGGTLWFYHKSFYDFIRDPKRSGSFSINPTAATKEATFLRYLKLHHDLAQSYTTQGSSVVLAPGIPNSAASLSWPYTNELVNSYLKAYVFTVITASLTSSLEFSPDLLQQQTLRKLSELDYRKHLILQGSLHPNAPLFHVTPDGFLNDRGGGMINVRGSLFGNIDTIGKYSARVFIEAIERHKNIGIIRPYHPTLVSKCASILFKKHQGQTRSGLYARGHGDKRTFWYWEFNVGLRYSRQFETCNLPDAQRIFELDKLALWGTSVGDKLCTKCSDYSSGHVQWTEPGLLILYFCMFLCILLCVCLFITLSLLFYRVQ